MQIEQMSFASDLALSLPSSSSACMSMTQIQKTSHKLRKRVLVDESPATGQCMFDSFECQRSTESNAIASGRHSFSGNGEMRDAVRLRTENIPCGKMWKLLSACEIRFSIGNQCVKSTYRITCELWCFSTFVFPILLHDDF